ncbi:LacI family transcriptional regulator [Bombiscardovia apis]|uniref:LacI family transcriptional regulator n=1 Tax=Bombiscardovia apis TaxID=2932182 RepID=A0ABN6SHD1_9BIFI|nr:LacI family DNA-binding transcriptional regulator [Bombiscardovia apis]BDR54321.1 LacI family transcriptional regulator [Bombiscardovia apis]
MGFVTIRDVARKAGVSTAAVSQILHDKGRFSVETQKLVRQTVEELGYIPDSRAQAMRSDSTRMVGILVPDLRNPYFANLVSSMETMLYEQGFGALIGTSDESVKRQDNFLMRLMGQRIDGVIAVPQGDQTPGIKMLVERDLPLVFVDRRVPGMDGTVPYVVSDPNPGLRDALATLRDYGHTSVAYVAHPSLGSFSVNERAEAFRELGPQFFSASKTAVFSCGESLESRKEALDGILDFGATAVIFGYSPDAISCISLLRYRGVELGREMSLASFDDIEAFRLLSPQVAVISQQVEQMGQQGVSILLDHIRGDHHKDCQPVSIPTSFDLRGSVGRVQ